ncbi:MAG: hypothetical protein V1822_00250 [Candidatus Micrarchaeota archaeon]
MDEKLEKVSCDLQGFEFYKINEMDIPENSYIISNQNFRDVLYNPHLAGIRLQKRMEKASVAAAKAISKLALEGKGIKKANLCECVFLSGGLFYDLNFGFSQQFGVSLPQCFMGIKRQKIEGTAGDFEAVAGYANFEALPDEATILIGDTTASGATLRKGILEISKIAENEGKKIERIVMFTLAAPLRAMREFSKACEEISEVHDGLEYYFLGAQQVFHLMEDGTDLRFRGPDAIIADLEIEYSRGIWGEWLCENMKCAIFDWGTRCKNPLAHINEFGEFAGKKLGECDEKGCAVLERMLDEAGQIREEYEEII